MGLQTDGHQKLRNVMSNPTVIGNARLNHCGLIIPALAVTFARHETIAAQPTLTLGAAASFGVLAATTVTTLPGTSIDGDLGVYAGATVTESQPRGVNAVADGDSKNKLKRTNIWYTQLRSC